MSFFLYTAYSDCDLVISTQKGKCICRGGFHDVFKTYLKKSELKNIRFHDLRHTRATLLLKQGVHPKIVSERLGHKDVFITLNRYSHVIPGMKEDAVKTCSERLFG
ncbi:tyrosine-type recombinase/integrase [Bacillus mycoides]|uniref:tyrosine-type recombinase/integrase n=1 Tax=Bacillus mycoides TaxID=1405 RepID=UPI003F7564AF